MFGSNVSRNGARVLYDLTVFPIRMSVWMKCNDKLNESFIAMPSKIQTAIKKVIWTPQWMHNQLRYLFSIDWLGMCVCARVCVFVWIEILYATSNNYNVCSANQIGQTVRHFLLQLHFVNKAIKSNFRFIKPRVWQTKTTHGWVRVCVACGCSTRRE